MRTTILAAILAAACEPKRPDVPAATPEQIEKARAGARQLQSLAEQYQLQKRACPDGVAALVAAGFAAPDTADPWGAEFAIACKQGGPIVVTSHGPDAKLGTPDDISSAR